MKKKMNKGLRIFLTVLVAAALLGVCFTSVALYAKREMEKPRFSMPEQDPLASAEAVPADAAAACDYVTRLLKATATDVCEISKNTEVTTDDGIETGDTAGLSDADKAIFGYIRGHANGELNAMFESYQNVPGNQVEELPALPFTAAELTDWSAAEGRTLEDGTVQNPDTVYVTLTEANEDKTIPADSEVANHIKKTLAPAVEIRSLELRQTNETVNAEIDRITGRITRLEDVREIHVQAAVTFIGEYAALGGEDPTFAFTYTEKEIYTFRHYGARFTERAIAASPDDMKALPADVVVSANAVAGEDYTLTFEPSDDSVMRIDQDGVMTVHGKSHEGEYTVKMTLEYGTHTYTDTLTVYITELEVETENVQ